MAVSGRLHTDGEMQEQIDALNAEKVDKVSDATSGNFAGLDENGNLTDSGSSKADFGKIIRVTDITEGSSNTVLSAECDGFVHRVGEIFQMVLQEDAEYATSIKLNVNNTGEKTITVDGVTMISGGSGNVLNAGIYQVICSANETYRLARISTVGMKVDASTSPPSSYDNSSIPTSGLMKSLLDTKSNFTNISANEETTARASKAYVAGEYLIYQKKVYRVTSDIAQNDFFVTTGANANITETDVGSEVSEIKNALSKSTENTNIAISAHQKHSLFWFNGSLHIALDDIAIGDTITTDGQTPNASEVTIDEALIKDVQIGGTSILDGQGVANIPYGTNAVRGVVVGNESNGLYFLNGVPYFVHSPELSYQGNSSQRAVTIQGKHYAAFYGLAKAAGADMANVSGATVGTYPETQKSAISQMLNGAVQVTGTTPVIVAKPGVPYRCGECATLDITAPASGDIEVIFDSGSTATVLTVTPPTGVTAIKWANGFDPTALDANTRYDLIITDGEWGLAASWGA